MTRIVFAFLTLCVAASLGGPADAADYSRHRRHHAHTWYGGDCCDRGVPYRPRLRVVEQVPYCGNCEDPVAWGPYYYNARLRYVGYSEWAGGCAFGGCIRYYRVGEGCYWRQVPLADWRGGWVWGVETNCY